MYQNAYVQYVANQGALNGVAMWNNNTDMYIQQLEKSNLKDTRPYWRIYDTSKEEKVKSVEEYVNYNLKNHSLVKLHGPNNVNVELDNKILYKKLVVRISCEVMLPGEGLFNMVGIKPMRTIESKGEALLNEPTEFIRNTDFVFDVINEIDSKTGNNLDSIKSNIQKKFSEIAGNIGEFMN